MSSNENVRADRARELVGYMQSSYGVSERRACDVFPTNRATVRYKSRRPDQAGLEMRIKELAATRVRYGYRRIHVLLRREGWQINHKKTRRIYRELGLQLRNKPPQAQSEGEAARGPGSGHGAQRVLVDGLPVGPVVRWAQDPGALHRRQLHPVVTGARCPVQLPRQRCGRHTGTDRGPVRAPEARQGRPRPRVYLEGSRPVGLPA